ncbi:hypothetical protein GCM10023205_78120 [Yinghuangia aomiensis]|uniref:Uncharacterized protein n=1 Tax=Yinghuangia aomiensis TaxID=676205 RepID=A0ABP9IBP4_9ACTN
MPGLLVPSRVAVDSSTREVERKGEAASGKAIAPAPAVACCLPFRAQAGTETNEGETPGRTRSGPSPPLKCRDPRGIWRGSCAAV